MWRYVHRCANNEKCKYIIEIPTEICFGVSPFEEGSSHLGSGYLQGSRPYGPLVWVGSIAPRYDFYELLSRLIVEHKRHQELSAKQRHLTKISSLHLHLPSRELTDPTWGKGKSSSNTPYQGDILIPWRVHFHPLQHLSTLPSPHKRDLTASLMPSFW